MRDSVRIELLDLLEVPHEGRSNDDVEHDENRDDGNEIGDVLLKYVDISVDGLRIGLNHFQDHRECHEEENDVDELHHLGRNVERQSP